MTFFINWNWSYSSSGVTLSCNPKALGFLRIPLRAREWMVETLGSLSMGVSRPMPRRSLSSPAALFVKVIAQMRRGTTPCSMSQRTRSVSTRVLPEPAPAIRTAGLPTGCSTAAFCSSLSGNATFFVPVLVRQYLGYVESVDVPVVKVIRGTQGSTISLVPDVYLLDQYCDFGRGLAHAVDQSQLERHVVLCTE